MKAVNFRGSNTVLGKPVNTTDAECHSLHVYSNGEQCLSLWKPSIKERFKILFTGKIWLWVWSGHTQPPVLVSSNTPFKKKTKKYKYRRWFFVFHKVGNCWSPLKFSIKKYNTVVIISWWRLALHIENKF